MRGHESETRSSTFARYISLVIAPISYPVTSRIADGAKEMWFFRGFFNRAEDLATFRGISEQVGSVCLDLCSAISTNMARMIDGYRQRHECFGRMMSLVTSSRRILPGLS